MRTTVTLEPDVVEIIDRAIAEHKITFKEAVNDAIRRGFVSSMTEQPFIQTTYDLGEPMIDLTHALAVASDLEDAEIVRKTELGK